jgi:hypothetical protein
VLDLLRLVAGLCDQRRPALTNGARAMDARWRRDQDAPVAQRSRVTLAPDGSEYEITVERAPRLGLFQAGLWRWWNTLRGDETWWVTVAGDRWAWRLLGERFESEYAAELRAEDLARAIAAGEVDYAGPAWRRRWGS